MTTLEMVGYVIGCLIAAPIKAGYQIGVEWKKARA